MKKKCSHYYKNPSFQEHARMNKTSQVTNVAKGTMSTDIMGDQIGNRQFHQCASAGQCSTRPADRKARVNALPRGTGSQVTSNLQKGLPSKHVQKEGEMRTAGACQTTNNQMGCKDVQVSPMKAETVKGYVKFD